MTEHHKLNLRVVQAYSKVLIEACDHEIHGGGAAWREETAMELCAAIRNLNPPPPGVHRVDWNEVGRQLDAE